MASQQHYQQKKPNTDPNHNIKVIVRGNEYHLTYKQLCMYRKLHQDYLTHGHHINTVYFHIDPGVFDRACRSTYDPLFNCPLEDIEEATIDPQAIQSPKTYLSYNLNRFKLEDDKYIHVIYLTRTHGRKKLALHPNYGTKKEVISGITYQTLTIGKFTTTLPLVNMRDGTDRLYMTVTFSMEEAEALISEYIFFEILPEIAKLPFSYYLMYDKLNMKHQKTFVKAYCAKLDKETKQKKLTKETTRHMKY